jgi:hypothetical protein
VRRQTVYLALVVVGLLPSLFDLRVVVVNVAQNPPPLVPRALAVGVEDRHERVLGGGMVGKVLSFFSLHFCN